MSSVKHPDDVPATPLLAQIGRALDAIAAELLARLEAAGFGDQTVAQSRVFGAIPADGIRLTELADRLHATKQAVGELVDQMETAGYVERTPDPADARAKLIGFTDKGWRAVRAALSIFDEIEAELAAEVGAKRVADARRVLETADRLYPTARRSDAQE